MLFTFLTGCITEFVPETKEEKELLVVEGLITDQPGINTVKLSKSMPFGKKSEAKPFSGCYCQYMLIMQETDIGLMKVNQANILLIQLHS